VSAAAVVSTAVVSGATSTYSVSAVSVSAVAAGLVLPPQDAKDIATTVAKANTNFFMISFTFKMLNNICFKKPMQRYELFAIRCTPKGVFFSILTKKTSFLGKMRHF
jgi:hypothetical protein